MASIPTIAVALSAVTAAAAVALSSDAAPPADSAATAVAAAGPATLVREAASALAERPLEGRVVHLDAGHNGGNAGAPSTIDRQVDAGGGVRKACDTIGAQTNDGRLTEAAFNLDVAMRLRALLRADGARVVMTRKSNGGVGPCITRRAAIGNEARADAAVSIHADGGPPGGRGFHVIRPKGVGGQSAQLLDDSDELGRAIHATLRAKGYRTATYIGKGGLDLRDDLGGLNLSRVPKVFVELGNMRNAADARLLKSTRQRQRMAQALADGIETQLTR